MLPQHEIISILNEQYPLRFDRLELLRDSGSVTYAAFSGSYRAFLRIVKPAFSSTAVQSLDVHLFLQKQGFPVPPLLETLDHSPYVLIPQPDGRHLLALYEFIEGEEVDPKQDAQALGALVGQFHSVMKQYPKPLTLQGKSYYLDKYLQQLRQKQYPRTGEFAQYGNAVWDRVKHLPRGYCHGDLYRGNILKTPDNKLYMIDFDTVCLGFPMYDLALICNDADYFIWEEDAYEKCRRIYERFLPEYLRYHFLSEREIQSFYDFLALYHFALQATILDIFGLDCVDFAFLDRQLDWLYQWQRTCENQRQ